MKKRLFAIALSLCMTLSLLPTTAFAAEMETETGVVCSDENCTHVAVAGGKHYASLGDAISATSEGEVALLKDITLPEKNGGVSITAGKKITLDLGTHTLSRAGSVLDIYGDLTLKNGTVKTTHGGEKNNTGAIWLNGSAKLTVDEDAVVEAAGREDNFAIGYWSDCTTAELVLRGKVQGGNGVTMNGNIGANTSNKLTVDGATIDVTGHGIYQAGCAETDFTINDSNISGSTGIEVRAGKLNVTNSTIKGGNTFKVEPHSNGTTTDGAGIAIAQHTTKQGIDVTISGGEISGKYAIYESNPQNNSPEDVAKVKLHVTGGNFTGDVYSENRQHFISGGTFSSVPDQKYLNEGYEIFKTSDGKIGVGQPADVTFQFGKFTPVENSTELNQTWRVYTGFTYADFPIFEDGFPKFKADGYEQAATWQYENGTQAKLTDKVTGAVTLTPVAGAKIEYKIGYLDETKNALTEESIANLAGAKHMGDTITFQVVAKEGYTAHAYTTCYGKKTEVELDNDLKGTFTMPDGNVDLIIEYIKDVVIDDDVADLVEDVEISAGKTTVATPDVKADTTEDEKNVMESATTELGKTKVVGDAALVNAANNSIDEGTLDVNKAITAKKDEIQAAVDAAKDGKGEDEQVAATVTVTPYLEIKVTDSTLGSYTKTVTMDITPKVAIKAEVEGQEAIDLGTQPLTVTDPIEMTLPVPTALGSEDIYVQHKGYEYETKKDGSNVTFTNPHGFSEFSMSNAPLAAAYNNGIRYTDLGLAINEAEANDKVFVTARAAGKSYTTGTGGKTVTLYKSSELNDFDVTINGTKYTLTYEGVSVTTPRSSSSSGGGSSSTGYSVSVTSPKNGSLSVTPKNASKGDTVTITVSADKGYELGKLTVTDKDGKTVKLTDKGNGKYTFTMPGSKVEVKAEFVEISTETANPFRDVSKNAYYYNQVLWAVEKGITSGASANEFAPEAACTRAQMVTFLWKAAGSPEVSGALAFNDVSSDAYYAKAVRWAAQQGITSGTSAGVFSPDAPCTRGQMAMFLYAYAKTPAATGTVPFADVNSNDYFNTAVLWAVNNGITSGTSSTTYSPASVCTRGQMVVFLYQLLNK